MSSISEKAYAKINYTLYVDKRRNDGFHDISTLMQTISLCDDVTVEIKEGNGIRLTINGDDRIPRDHTNLMWRAAEVFLEKIGECCAVSMHLEKKIPMAGGLAGGSADAAAVLRAMNQLFDNYFTRDMLEDIAGMLGSDIPFCIRGGLVHCTGRGEKMETLAAPAGRRHFLIVNRGEEISTPRAYALLDERADRLITQSSPKRCLHALELCDASLKNVLFNSFEEIVLPQCPLASEAKTLLAEAGAVATLMSGSGSTVFGIFKDEKNALNAQKKLPFQSIYAYDTF